MKNKEYAIKITALLTACIMLLAAAFLIGIDTVWAAGTHPVTGLKASSSRFCKIDLTWNCKDYDGKYTIYRVKKKGKLKKVATTGKTTYTVKGLTPGKKYKFKVKSDSLSGTVSKKVISVKKARTTIVRTANGDRWDIRSQAGQKLYDYDTVQGACCHGGYAYLSLYNRDKERIKIAKVDLETMKVVKVSSPIRHHCHANTLTYDPNTDRIAAVCGKGGKKKVAFISARTLKQTEVRTFKLKSSFVHTRYYGVGGLAFNEEKNQYVLKVYGKTNKIVRYNKKLKGKKYIRITGNRSYLLPQGIYAEGNYMYDLQSFQGKYKYNLITIRTMKGKLVGRINVPCGSGKQLFELEALFHDKESGQWYVCFYRAHVKASGDTDRKNYLARIEKNW